MFSWTMLISGNKLAEQIRRFIASIFPRHAATDNDLNEDKNECDVDEGLTS